MAEIVYDGRIEGLGLPFFHESSPPFLGSCSFLDERKLYQQTNKKNQQKCKLTMFVFLATMAAELGSVGTGAVPKTKNNNNNKGGSLALYKKGDIFTRSGISVPLPSLHEHMDGLTDVRTGGRTRETQFYIII